MKPIEDKPFEFQSSLLSEPIESPRATPSRRANDRPFEFLEKTTLAIDETPPREFDLAKVASRYKWVIVVGLISGLVLGHAAFVTLGPEYDAVAQILVTRKAQVPVRESLSQALLTEGRGEHVAVIDSPLIVGKAMELGNLDELPTLSRSDDPIEDILEGLSVKRTAGQDSSTLNVFEIKYHNKQTEDAKAVVNAIISAYQHYLQEMKEESTSELTHQITKMDGELAKRIEKKQGELLDFRKDAPLWWRSAPGEQRQPGDVTNVHQERVVDIERDRRLNLLRKAEINGKIRALQNAIDQSSSPEELEGVVRLLIATSQAASGAQAATGGAIPLLGPNPVELASNQLLPLLIEEQKLLRDYSDDHPEVINVRRSISKLKEFYEARGLSLTQLFGRDGRGQKLDAVSGYMKFLKQQLDEIDHKDAELTKVYESESQAVKDVVKFMVEDQARSEELDRLKTQWNAIVNNFGHLDLTRDSQDYSMKILAPVRAEWSLKRYLKITGAVTALALGLCLGIVFLREWRDTTVKTVSEVRKLIAGAQVLGSVPQFNVHRGDYDPDVPLEPSLCYFHRPGSAEAEAYRAIRTALIVGLDPKQKVIQVSSPEPGDGKSTFLSNMAIALAQSGKRVMLLDADLRRPTIHRLFHARSEIGTADVLKGEIQLVNAVQASCVKNLWLLTAGHTPPNPAETLSSTRFDALLAEARREFDFVLVDSPPLLAVSDPCIVASRTDGLVLVVRTNKNSREALRQTNLLIRQHGIPLFGVVANAVEHQPGEYSAYSGNSTDYLRPTQPALTPV